MPWVYSDGRAVGVSAAVTVEADAMTRRYGTYGTYKAVWMDHGGSSSQRSCFAGYLLGASIKQIGAWPPFGAPDEMR